MTEEKKEEQKQASAPEEANASEEKQEPQTEKTEQTADAQDSGAAEAEKETAEAAADEQTAVEEEPAKEPADGAVEESEEPTEFPVKFIIGKKVGMGRIFADNGDMIPITYIEAGPCVVTQIKTADRDGYNAIQLAFGSKKEKLITKPIAGHLKKSGLETARYFREVRVEETEGVKLGQKVRVDLFNEGDIVHVTAVSKGLGFQGGVRRHGFGGGDKTHGQSDRLRAPGSIGQSSYPSRVFKGTRMAGRMGKDTVTVKNLRIVGVDTKRNYLMIRGAVPGKPNNFVKVRAAR
ncbi:MAG: 50S ribosomal protein L3 [candidate division Zixibacteria bacterium]|nr:50S ribosomal protein L3 [candidate division Zixibacteria bacterium]